jgi:hypothetical protein
LGLFDGLFLLQDYIDGLNDQLVRVRFAINSDQMNAFLDARDIERAFLGEAIVPTAIPNAEEVGVFLKRPGKPRAGQLFSRI